MQPDLGLPPCGKPVRSSRCCRTIEDHPEWRTLGVQLIPRRRVLGVDRIASCRAYHAGTVAAHSEPAAHGPTVTARARVSVDAQSFADAVLHLIVEDVTMADARSAIVGHIDVPGIDHEIGMERIVTAEVPVKGIDPQRMYRIRAHLDLSGDGHVAIEDFVTDTRHQVLTCWSPDRIYIALVPVRRSPPPRG